MCVSVCVFFMIYLTMHENMNGGNRSSDRNNNGVLHFSTFKVYNKY